MAKFTLTIEIDSEISEENIQKDIKSFLDNAKDASNFFTNNDISRGSANTENSISQWAWIPF